MQHQKGKKPGKGGGPAEGPASSLPPWASQALSSVPRLQKVASLKAVGWTGLAGALAELADAGEDRWVEYTQAAITLSASALGLSQQLEFAADAALLAVAVDAACR